MAGSHNTITLIGNLGRDPESRFLPDGTPVASFSVATTERWKDRSGQPQERTTWFRVSAFGKLAETCNQYLRKGSYVYIEGPLTQREYTDRDGNARTSLDVRAREMRMLDKAGENRGDFGGGGGGDYRSQGSAPAPRQSAPSGFDDTNNMDDIPF